MPKTKSLPQPEPQTKTVDVKAIYETKRLAFVRKPISAWHFFERISQSISRNQELADEWFIHEAWEIADAVIDTETDGVPGVEVITRPMTDDEYETLGFKTRGKLDYLLVDVESNRMITLNDDADSLADSEDFTTADGYQFYEAPNAGQYFSEFKKRLAKNEGQAMYWAIKTFILCNETPVTDAMLKDPDGIGYSNAILLYKWLQGFLA